MIVYLCGPIEAISTADASHWREIATVRLGVMGFKTLDPMRQGFHLLHGEPGIAAKIVAADLADLDACDLVLRYAPFPSEGSAQEAFYAHKVLEKPVVVVLPEPRFAPWLTEHCEIYLPTLDDALRYIGEHYDPRV